MKCQQPPPGFAEEDPAAFAITAIAAAGQVKGVT